MSSAATPQTPVLDGSSYTNRSIVTGWFRTRLDRDPTPSELESIAGYLDWQTPDGIARAIAEFDARFPAPIAITPPATTTTPVVTTTPVATTPVTGIPQVQPQQTNWLLLGGLALGAYFLFSSK